MQISFYTALLTNDGKSGKELNENYLRYVPIITHTMYNSDPEKLAEISERIKVYYFGTTDIGPQTDSQLVNVSNLLLFFYDHFPSEFLFP